MFAPAFFPPRYFPPRYFVGVGAEASVEVGVGVSRGDGVPMWFGVSSPPIPTLGMVGRPAPTIPIPTTPIPIVRTPLHHREVVRVSLGTLHVRIVQETYTIHIHERIAIAYGTRVVSEQCRGREKGSIVGRLIIGAHTEASHQRVVEIVGPLYETSAVTLTSPRIRMVRNDRETVRVPLALQIQACSSSPSHDGAEVIIPWVTSHAESINQPVVMRESYLIQTAHRLTYQPALTSSEAAAIAAVMLALGEAA